MPVDIAEACAVDTALCKPPADITLLIAQYIHTEAASCLDSVHRGRADLGPEPHEWRIERDGGE